ncbi:nitrate reductase cytochrome c-type subunit [Inhella sp.]|uniref:nitrate reductase cytochrome c-type subunit n=1 Tax=Inhella sp. TaxID=1921806 RepID=UPI0035AFD8B4
MKVPGFFKRFGPVLLALSVFAIGVDQARAADPKPATAAEPVKLQGLRGGTPLNQDNPPANHRQERDHPVGDRDFVQMPPLIPHTIGGYQITKNFNKCMDCHAWQKTKESGATKISVTHFKTREGVELDTVSPRRYFCTQCHVPQSDAKPLVGNTYERAKGMK